MGIVTDYNRNMGDMEVICMYVESLTGISTRQMTANAPAPKAAAPAETGKKTESTDGDISRQVEIARDGDDAVTLSIMADDPLVDDHKNVNMDRLKKVMEQVTAALPNSSAKFGIHEKTNHMTIKLVDRDTQEVIKEFPPEEILDMMAKRMELAGVMVDERL